MICQGQKIPTAECNLEIAWRVVYCILCWPVIGVTNLVDSHVSALKVPATTAAAAIVYLYLSSYFSRVALH